MLDAGARVVAYDPEAMNNVAKVLGDKIEYGVDEYAILNEADALIICTEWSLFRTPDFEKIKLLMKNNVIFDGRNLYSLEQMQHKGFYYSSIGRAVVSPQ